jgi:transposase InsO family protein
LTTTDYFTRWTEAIPLKIVNQNQVISFIEQFIITRFGVPNTLVFDNASYFSSIKLTEFSLEKGIKIRYSANYYPQGNGLVESTNKNLL